MIVEEKLSKIWIAFIKERDNFYISHLGNVTGR